MNLIKTLCWALVREQTAPEGRDTQHLGFLEGLKDDHLPEARNKHLSKHHHVSMCISLNETQQRWVTNSEAVLCL